MAATFHLTETVSPIDDVPEESLRHGEVGTIVHVYELPNNVEAYDVAFLSPDGTTREVVLNVSQLERVERAPARAS